VEHIIREDFLIESLEYLELLCELIHERVNYIKSQKDCPADLVEAVSSLIWATDRVEIPELKEVQKQLIKKYGSEFGKEAKEGQHVNERLLAKLSVANPTALLVTRYLEEIAKEYKVQWTPTDRGMPNSLDEAFPTPQGFSIPMAPGTELRSAYQRQQNMVSSYLRSFCYIVMDFDESESFITNLQLRVVHQALQIMLHQLLLAQNQNTIHQE
jgi:vacuolar protein sorting-associated protein IST1